ncbi:MAG: TatD family hydrolase [Myxococcota bacterium]
MIIDSHCHIDAERFDRDRAEVLARAEEAGVGRMIVIGAGADLDNCRSAVALAEAHDHVWATVGIHPHDARRCDEDVYATIRDLTAHPKVVAVGETGLDYHYDHSPRGAQVEAFRRFIAMARDVSLPLVLHIRDAHEEALAVLREEDAGAIGGVVHCFTGTSADARAYLEMGFHLGITGIVTFKKAGDLKDVVREAPLERLLVETDSPYLAPTPHRGKRNEPAFVARVVDAIADLREATAGEIARRTTANTNRLFALPA